jgi:hypothetical protein
MDTEYWSFESPRTIEVWEFEDDPLPEPYGRAKGVPREPIGFRVQRVDTKPPQ